MIPKKLTKKTKPRKLTLGQIWKLCLADTDEVTAEFVISVLDAYYPNKDRENMNVFDKMAKYSQAKVGYSGFLGVIKGMVGNG